MASADAAAVAEAVVAGADTPPASYVASCEAPLRASAGPPAAASAFAPGEQRSAVVPSRDAPLPSAAAPSAG